MQPLGSILVGIDFSPCSMSALSQAVRIGEWSRATVHALHVIDTLALVELELAYSPLVVEVHRQFQEDAKRSWAQAARDIAGADRVRFETVTNNPLTAIVQACRETNSGLLVMGVHGPSAHDGAGTLASKCVRTAPADVLLVEEGHASKFRRVVACVDFSETSRRALEYAMRVAAQDGAEVHVIHVFRAPWKGLHFRSAAVKDDAGAQARYRDVLRTNLEAFCRPASPEMTWVHPRFDLVEAPSHGVGIARYVRDCAADLVVLGTRGRTNLRDVVLGSTAERVVREAPCAILAVRPAE